MAEQTAKAPDEELPPGMIDAKPEVVGGAVVKEVEIEPIAPEMPEAEDTVNIVTYAVGTLGIGGIAPIGTKATIAISAYSQHWMRPITKGDAAKLKKAGKALAP